MGFVLVFSGLGFGFGWLGGYLGVLGSRWGWYNMHFGWLVGFWGWFCLGCLVVCF